VPAPRASAADDLALPDLDKSDESDEVDVGNFELSIADDAESEEDVNTVDTFEVDIQVLTDSGGNEAASDLDIGEAGLVDTLPEEAGGPDDELAQPADNELDDHLATPLEGDDTSTDAELGDDGLEALPELVVEEGDGEAGPDVERAFLPSAPEGEIPEGPRYEVEWLLLGSACGALAAHHGDVLAAAEHLMRFGSERRSDPLPAGTRITSLAVVDGAVTALTTRGVLQAPPHGGTMSFSEPPELARASGAELVELAATEEPPALWARLRSGVLLRRAGVWERHQTGGEVRSLSAHGQQVSLLVLAGRPTLQLSSDGGSSFRELLLAEPAKTVALGGAPLFAAVGKLFALADGERGLCVSADGGETFRMVTGAVNVTAVTIGEHAGKPAIFAALYRESKDVSELIAVDPATGLAVRIAALAGEPDEDTEEVGRTTALLHVDGYLWSAGGYGLARLSGPRR
jgi:hypothetical protein